MTVCDWCGVAISRPGCAECRATAACDCMADRVCPDCAGDQEDEYRMQYNRTLLRCKRCGSVVPDEDGPKQLHDDWHARLEHVAKIVENG